MPAKGDIRVLLADPVLHEEEGRRRVGARIRVSRGSDVLGESDFTSPLGPVEVAELSWYLEVFPSWPFGPPRDRARRIEALFPRWQAALRDVPGLGPSEGETKEQIVITVDDPTEPGLHPTEIAFRRRLAAHLSGLPWELLAMDVPGAFRVRRCPVGATVKGMEPTLPLRILLVVARPDETELPFLDPRASLRPILDAVAPGRGRVELDVLQDGTLCSLQDALASARNAGRPIHVVHFDGHGAFDPVMEAGVLCFEAAAQGPIGGVDPVSGPALGRLFAEHEVRLVVLEACKSAVATREISASIADHLIQAGVGSVLAMSHAVRLDSSALFGRVFYRELARGASVGEAVVVAREILRQSSLPGTEAGSPCGRFLVQDWFVPILFQADGADGPLVAEGRVGGGVKAESTLGDLPLPPPHGFVGRGRDLLLLARILVDTSTVVVVGEGGQGKTALAVELARWMVDARRVDRVAFVSVETHGELSAFLDRLGQQTVADWAIARREADSHEGLTRAVEEALSRQSTLLVVDNLESVLGLPGEELRAATRDLLDLLDRLARQPNVRLLLTSREEPPSSADSRHVHRLGPVSSLEGEQIVSRVLLWAGREPLCPVDDAPPEHSPWIRRLVDVVGGHVRSLVLLAPLLAEQGLEATAEAVERQMVVLEQSHPSARERSLLASVGLSMARLPAPVLDRIAWIGLFRQAFHVSALAWVSRRPVDEAISDCRQLVGLGLAESDGPYVIPDPALHLALRPRLDAEAWAFGTERWIEATLKLAQALYDQHYHEAHLAARGTRLVLADLLAVLDILVARAEADPSASVAQVLSYLTCIEQLLQPLGRPRVAERIAALRRRFVERMEVWTHDRFAAEGHEVLRCLQVGSLEEAQGRVDVLLERMQAVGHQAYPEASYDLGMADWLAGSVLLRAGRAREALPWLVKAEARFSGLAAMGEDGAGRMGSVSLADKGDALRHLGRFDEAAEALRQAIRMDSERQDLRQAARNRVTLGVVRLGQRHFEDALETFQRARVVFETIQDPVETANVWHQSGLAWRGLGRQDRAEQAFQRALRIRMDVEDRAGEATTLSELGNLHAARGHLEEAASFYGQAAEIFHLQGDAFREARVRSNLGLVHHHLGHLDEARQALLQSVELSRAYGHSAQPWKTWSVLDEVERARGQPEAAMEATHQAERCYLAYRREGGEPSDAAARLVAHVGLILVQEGPDAAIRELPAPEAFDAAALPLRSAMEEIIEGSRSQESASNQAFSYTVRIEFVLLLEMLRI